MNTKPKLNASEVIGFAFELLKFKHEIEKECRVKFKKSLIRLQSKMTKPTKLIDSNNEQYYAIRKTIWDKFLGEWKKEQDIKMAGGGMMNNIKSGLGLGGK